MKANACIALFLAVLMAPEGIRAGETLSEQQVVREVLAANPMLKASAAKWMAMKERVPQAKAWDDPMVGVDFERRGSKQFTKYSDAEWMVSQTLPIGGKNLSRGRAAEAEARAAYEAVRRMRLDLTAKAKAACYRLANAHAQLAISRENRGNLESVLTLGNARLAVGKTALADVLSMQMDIQRIDVERASLEQALSEQQTALNVLMNRRPGSPLGSPAVLTFRAMPWQPATLEARLVAQRPELAAAAQRLKAEEARLQLAHRQWIPEPQVRVEARHLRGSGDTFTEYDTGIFFSVPWANQRKYSAGVREAEQMVEAMRQEIDSERNAALGMLRDQLRKVSTLRRQYELSSGELVPLARKTAETLQANYQAGSAGFVELLTAQRMRREAAAAASMQLADYLSALAELETIVGDDPAETAAHKAVIAPAKRRKP